MNNVSANLHDYRNTLVKTHNYIQNYVDHF